MFHDSVWSDGGAEWHSLSLQLPLTHCERIAAPPESQYAKTGGTTLSTWQFQHKHRHWMIPVFTLPPTEASRVGHSPHTAKRQYANLVLFTFKFVIAVPATVVAQHFDACE